MVTLTFLDLSILHCSSNQYFFSRLFITANIPKPITEVLRGELNFGLQLLLTGNVVMVLQEVSWFICSLPLGLFQRAEMLPWQIPPCSIIGTICEVFLRLHTSFTDYFFPDFYFFYIISFMLLSFSPTQNIIHFHLFFSIL